jgi:hypothetical protein
VAGGEGRERSRVEAVDLRRVAAEHARHLAARHAREDLLETLLTAISPTPARRPGASAQKSASQRL